MYNTDLPTRADLPSTGKLLRSTVIAALVAAGLLVTTVLPAEYGIDPTGIGGTLGLTRMGEIKTSLAAEAQADAQADATAQQSLPAAPAAPAPTAQAPVAAAPAAPAAPAESAAGREDTMVVKLKPGQATEIKLVMHKGASVRYEWSSAGGAGNYDTHGDPVDAPKGFYHGYGKGRNKAGEAGELQAAFDGKHGWFWRNRSGSEVTITLKTGGDYVDIQKIF